VVVLAGVGTATFIVHGLSVTIGHFVGLSLPERPIAFAAAIAFLLIALWTWRERQAGEGEVQAVADPTTTFFRGYPRSSSRSRATRRRWPPSRRPAITIGRCVDRRDRGNGRCRRRRESLSVDCCTAACPRDSCTRWPAVSQPALLLLGPWILFDGAPGRPASRSA
jgi:Uncharacterized protein family UPF0016